MPKEEKTWTEDEFGVIRWEGYSQGSTWVVEGHNPFSELLRVPLASAPHGWKESAIDVHDTLEIARTIAVSIFGKHWRELALDVLKRVQYELLNEGRVMADTLKISQFIEGIQCRIEADEVKP